MRLDHIGTHRDPARVGVLDDRHGRLVEVVRGPAGGVGVDVVVVGHLLAVQLFGLRETSALPGAVQRRPLVRVLAVAQHADPVPGGAHPMVEALRRGHVRVGVGGGDDRDAGGVLGGTSHHRRPADVDLLDALLRRSTGGDGVGERVEVGDQQLERLDPELG